MADLTTIFAGRIHSPNPFWLASGPPANCGEQVMRAFDAGWGGAVWKTLGDPIVNVTSRYSSVDWAGQRMMGLNNIELITDRPLEVNLREIAEVKRRYPQHAVIASLMVESKREAWHEIVKQAEDAGADGLELNFGCPHGMSERGMGSAVGQVPEYTTLITAWVKEVARTPVLVKLTPNISDIRAIARAARRGGADDEPRIAPLVAGKPHAPGPIFWLARIIYVAGSRDLHPGRVVGDGVVPGQEREVAGLSVVAVRLEEPAAIHPHEGLPGRATPRWHGGGQSRRRPRG